jgi:hypothetical protein
MQPITIKPRPDNVTAVGTDRGDYVYGDAQDRFLRPDWDMDTIKSFISSSNEPIDAISLPALGNLTWDKVSELLPGGEREVKLMRDYSQYEDAYTGRFTDSLYPLLILTRDVTPYRKALQGKESADRIRWATFLSKDVPSLLEDLTESSNTDARVALGRVSQVLIGTGFTRMCLPTDGSAVIEWQFAELSNGDILALAGYEWFNK